MKKHFILLSLISLMIVECVYSQEGNKINSYRSTNNLLYWKNRKPFEGYWQQDVHYIIKASIDDKTDIVDGHEDLTYWNNSPEELTFVYFHLYSNAQVKNSYLANLYSNNGQTVKYGKYQQQELGTTVSKISVNGIELKTELDNTVLKVYLTEPLKPNQSVTFNIDFKTYYDNGTLRNRMKMFNAFGYKHYDLVHWYPRISVYDTKFGWDTQQHLDHEFYGDYGSYEVELTWPNNYIVEGTGDIINKDEVLPQDLRKQLDIRNFAAKPWNEKPSEIVKPDGTTKTWKFFAINVHDFAATGDPTYRIGEADCIPNGYSGAPIKCISLVQEPHASRWQNAADYTAKVIKTYSEDFGMYIYPKMIVADARDGMEYPMLTLDGGGDPDYRGLLAHEIGHNWFFGMVGNNETYRAMLDEGFTQFLTSWALEKIDGKYAIQNPPVSKYVAKFREDRLVRNSSVYSAYINDAIHGSEATINTHSDEYETGLAHSGGYRLVYYKTATMLYNLQYVLGDSLFKSAMQHYFSQWKVCHPYIENFRNSITESTHTDLNWFFDQWIETSKAIDYKVKSVRGNSKTGEYTIAFKRKEHSMQMPIDFTVYTDTLNYKYHIPNTWFVKKTDATVLPRWIGWNNLQPVYEAKIKVPGKITNVVIDPTNRLADAYMLDNSKRFPVKTSFDSKIYNIPDWTNYALFYRPELWYNAYDGLKIGWHINGNYMNYHHIFDATLWLNTGFFQNTDALGNVTTSLIGITNFEYRNNHYDDLNFRLNYRTATDKFMKGSTIYGSAKQLDGLSAYTLGFDRKSNSGKTRAYVFFKSMYRKNTNALYYLILPNEWGVAQYNNSINIGLEHRYTYKSGNGNINLALRSSTLESNYDYSYAMLTAINRNEIAKKISFNTRFFMQYGTGANWANESSLFLAGANPEEMMDNKFTRSQGFFSPSMASYGAGMNNFQYGGGLNLRGYAGYLAPEIDANGNLVMTYKGSSGAAVNAELEFTDLVNFKPKWFRNWLKFSGYLFGDAGVINVNQPTETLALGNVRADAGIGTALTIKKFGPLQTVEPLTIRFDMPLFLNRIPATETNYFAFRWVVGVSRAF